MPVDNPFIQVKVEKQITWPLPQFDAFLFLLRQYIVAPDMKELYHACVNMNEQEREYKGVTQELINYMEIEHE